MKRSSISYKNSEHMTSIKLVNYVKSIKRDFEERLPSKLTEIYKGCIQIGTLNGLPEQHLAVIFPAKIDCFLKIIDLGCKMRENENSMDAKRCLEKQSVNTSEVMMSDGSSALTKIARFY
eukprot:snap_masked-scaffold_3-processed-gene-8.20-mRNA-1 protein AED:1.00 eAED:1.00 QI:0/0/0/0/1/1/2/0/119